MLLSLERVAILRKLIPRYSKRMTCILMRRTSLLQRKSSFHTKIEDICKQSQSALSQSQHKDFVIDNKGNLNLNIVMHGEVSGSLTHGNKKYVY